MIAAYLLMISLAPKEINLYLLERQNWNLSHLFCIVPLMLTTFSFPGIVPYLNRNLRAIQIAIIEGTSLTFIVYCYMVINYFRNCPK